MEVSATALKGMQPFWRSRHLTPHPGEPWIGGPDYFSIREGEGLGDDVDERGPEAAYVIRDSAVQFRALPPKLAVAGDCFTDPPVRRTCRELFSKRRLRSVVRLDLGFAGPVVASRAGRFCLRRPSMPDAMERADAEFREWLTRNPLAFAHEEAKAAHRLYAAACEERVRLLNQSIDGFMRDALVAIAGAVCTPEKGYLEDGGLRLLLRDITELRRMHDHYRKRMQSDEDQLCRIAKAIGKDATGAPEHDRAIAGAAIETLTAAQSRIAELEQALAAERHHIADWKHATGSQTPEDASKLRTESERYRDLCCRQQDAINDLKGMADAVEALRDIGRLVGCGHVDDPDGRRQLVNCVDQELAKSEERVKEATDAINEYLDVWECMTGGNPLRLFCVGKPVRDKLYAAVGRDPIPERIPEGFVSVVGHLAAAHVRITELETALAQYRERDQQMKSRLDGVYGALADAGTVVVRTDDPGESVRELVQALAQTVAERDEARRGYHALDANWATVHNAFSDAIRGALGMPDATVPELVAEIERRTQALAQERQQGEVYRAEFVKAQEECRQLRQAAIDAFMAADEERLQKVYEANAEAEKWKSEDDMYGWNFHQGVAGGMTRASIIFFRVKRLLEATPNINPEAKA